MWTCSRSKTPAQEAEIRRLLKAPIHSYVFSVQQQARPLNCNVLQQHHTLAKTFVMFPTLWRS